MLVVSCDACHKQIDRDDGGWFGVDYQAPPVEVEPDEDGQVVYAEVLLLGQDHEYHFDSADCLVSWAMNRAFTPQPSEGTTKHE